MSDSVVPSSYEAWRSCITEKCKIALTEAYMSQRITVLSDPDSDETRTFRRLYGDAHWRAVLGWFQRALTESKN